MSAPDFAIYVEDDVIRVRFVNAKTLGRIPGAKKHRVGADYRDRVVRLPRGDYRASQRAELFHELGHYFFDRHDLAGDVITEEDYCDGLAWLPKVLSDPRNGKLWEFLVDG